MRLTRKAALAGLASLALAGGAWAAGKPGKADVNVMQVALPGGGVATISYSGEVAPRVVVGQGPSESGAARSAALDRYRAAMAYRAALLRERMRLHMAALEAQARAAGAEGARAMRRVGLPGLGTAAGVSLPPGAVSYSSVTRVTGNGTCTETVQVTRTSADAQPRVVRRTSGTCAAGAPERSNLSSPRSRPPPRGRE